MANVKKFIMSDGTEVEIPSGGSDKRLTLLAEVTTTEDLNSIEITQTDDGTPLKDLNVTSFSVAMITKFVETTNYDFMNVYTNDKKMCDGNIQLKSSDYWYRMNFEILSDGFNRNDIYHGNGSVATVGTVCENVFTRLHSSAKPFWLNQTVEKVRIKHEGGGLFATGTVIYLYAYI